MSASSQKVLNWEAPCGQLLLRLIKDLPQDRPITLNVFGSSPLQLQLDQGFLSGDVDLFCAEDLTPLVKNLKLDKGQSEPYIEICPESTFGAAPSWVERAEKIAFGNVTVILAAPIDILVSKIKRLEHKDLMAFDLVHERTGGPSEEELKHALGRVVDMYRPAFDEENPGGDPVANTRRLWQHLYGHEIDVRKEIIEPALHARKEAYGENAPDARHLLDDIAKAVPRTEEKLPQGPRDNPPPI